MTGGDDAAKRSRLSARSVEDLAVVAALLQDAIVPVGDMAYLADEKSFVLALNRFRWETGEGAETRLRDERTDDRSANASCALHRRRF